MTAIEAIIFSLIFQWAFSSSEYKEGEKLDRLGVAPAQRTKTFKAIFDAMNLSDIIAGTIVAFQLLFVRVQSRYGAAQAPQRQKGLSVEDQVHLEPLSGQRNIRGYDYGMPQEHNPSQSQYGMRAELGREDYYSRTSYAGGESPENQPLQQIRPMY